MTGGRRFGRDKKNEGVAGPERAKRRAEQNPTKK